MKRILICLTWALLLSACAGDAQTKATAALAVSCETGAALLGQLALRRSKGELSTDAIRKTTSAKGLLDTVCLPDSPFDPASVTTAIDNAITILKGV